MHSFSRHSRADILKRKRVISLITSLFIHSVLFIPPLQITFERLFYFKIFTPPPAVIRFQFFAPVPQKEVKPTLRDIFKPRDPDGIPEKSEGQIQNRIQELTESIESKRKSKAIKTIVPPKEVDKDKIKWDYALFIQKTIQRHLIYPEPEKSQKVEESVRVTFCVSKDGRLIGRPEIPEFYRSRFHHFNTSAIEAVIKASESFPPLPVELEKDRQYFDIVIEFRQ
ncbi:MAG: hypothetical protein JW928_04420 [Candidatus Aureabacteria bacterium]|nr:hypothetical protein [Candidatus Auribacterota bacterium]